MGSDYTSLQVFAGGRSDPRSLWLDRVVAACGRIGYEPWAASDEREDEFPEVRRVAVGPVARWITVYDSAGRNNWDAVAMLASALSADVPVVHVLSTDHWFFTAHLYRDGARVDVYGSSPNMRHEGDGDAGTLHGSPAAWAGLERSTRAATRMWPALQAGDRTFTSALDALVKGLGWDRQLASTGFWETGEGEDLRYTRWMEHSVLRTFDELVFRRAARS